MESFFEERVFNVPIIFEDKPVRNHNGKKVSFTQTDPNSRYPGVRTPSDTKTSANKTAEPSSATSRLGKVRWSKSDDEKLLKTEQLTVVIIDEGAEHQKRCKLSSERMDILEAHISECIDSAIEENVVIPRFQQSIRYEDYLKIVCSDMQSKCWLYKTLNGKRLWTEGCLKVVGEEEILELARVSVFIPGRMEKTSSILTRLEGMNTPIQATKWKVFHEGNHKPDGRLIVFGLDADSLEILKERHYRLHYGLGQITFRILRSICDYGEIDYE